MRRTVAGVVLVLVAAVTATAQTPPPGGPPPQDPIGRLLYPPELVMQHQSDIGLTDAQRDAIQKALLATQAKFMDMQWKMSGESEKLAKILGAAPVDEAQALDQLDRILTAERDVKKAQIGLLIRIKNTLTRDQQAKLDKLRQPQPRGN